MYIKYPVPNEQKLIKVTTSTTLPLQQKAALRAGISKLLVHSLQKIFRETDRRRLAALFIYNKFGG